MGGHKVRPDIGLGECEAGLKPENGFSTFLYSDMLMPFFVIPKMGWD
jgi:hypothetical protein